MTTTLRPSDLPLVPPLPDDGTPGDDLLVGDDMRDVFRITDTGADTIRARGSNDQISVRHQDGGDLIDGGDGFDLLKLDYRGSSVDVVIDLTDPDRPQTLADGTRIVRVESLVFRGGDGDDSLVLAAPPSILDGALRGGAGNDSIIVGPSFNTGRIFGGAGDDTLVGGSNTPFGGDELFGGAGDDALQLIGDAGTAFGGGGDDTVTASDGVNAIYGEGGADLIDAGGGEDTVNGGAGRDTVDAGAGDDVVISSADEGADSLDGGEGFDRIVLDRSRSDLALVFSLGDPDAVVTLNDGVRLTGFEFLQFDGGSGDDQVTARDGALDGGGGDDTLTAVDGGSTELSGGDGEDMLTGGDGRDTIQGDDGADTIRGGDGDDVIDGGRGRDDVSGGGGDDLVLAVEAFGRPGVGDTLDGGDGRDTLSYATARTGVTVDLAAGTDFLGNTISGFEILLGSEGDDRLTGSDGADVIRGALGADTLFGGDGADRFVYGADLIRAGAAPDSIEDFSHAQRDRIDLSRIDAIRGGSSDDFVFIGSDVFSAAGQLRAVETDPGVFVVSGDRDGDGQADFEIIVKSTESLQESDFIL